MDYNEVNLSLLIPKTTYRINETIDVQILPADRVVNLAYGNISMDVQGNAQLVAQPFQNRIEATSEDAHAEQVIHVITNDKLALFVTLSVFSGANYVIYLLMRKYWGWWL